MNIKIPLNRIVAAFGPHITIFSAGVATWLVARVDVLGIPGLNQANTATWIAGAITFLLTAAVSHLSQLSWLKGHHIELANEGQVDAANVASWHQPEATNNARGEDGSMGTVEESNAHEAEWPGDAAHPLFDDVPMSDPAHLTPDFDDNTVQEHRGGNSPMLAGTPAASGLSAAHRQTVRNAVMKAVSISFAHSGNIGYTQGSQRWEWKAKDLFASLGKYPTNLDCSAWATWVLYQGLRLFQVRDLVNGEGWLAGYTGTMLEHGKLVKHEENIKWGDLAIYNGHVAVCIGGGLVASHGSPGIHKLPLHYRGDLICVRRYI